MVNWEDAGAVVVEPAVRGREMLLHLLAKCSIMLGTGKLPSRFHDPERTTAISGFSFFLSLFRLNPLV